MKCGLQHYKPEYADYVSDGSDETAAIAVTAFVPVDIRHPCLRSPYLGIPASITNCNKQFREPARRLRMRFGFTTLLPANFMCLHYENGDVIFRATLTIPPGMNA